MITAVLDTSVLASGFVGRLVQESTPGELVRRWEQNQYTLAISDHILRELARTFDQPYFTTRLPAKERADALDLLRKKAPIFAITASVSGVATHPEDDLVLAAAVSTKADYLVTGDAPLRRRVPQYQGVKILSPREFLDLLQAEGGTR